MGGKTNNHQQIIEFPGTGDDMPKLTTKQQAFVDVYAGDIKEAAKEAGISYNYGRELMTKPHVVAPSVCVRKRRCVRT